MKKKNSTSASFRQNRYLAPLAGATLLLASLASTTAMARPVDIRIDFDARPCPIGVDSEPSVRKGRQVRWQAYDHNGQPEAIAFKIYFDPINGGFINGQPGFAQRPINNNVPVGLYKYTVLGDSCPDYTYDPNIRVSN